MGSGASHAFFSHPGELRPQHADRLIFVARWLGFHHAPIKDSEGLTRWKQHEAHAGEAPTFPAIEAGGYLLQAFLDLGCAQATGMSLQPLSWGEIDAFARLTGELTEPWEARLVRRMSLAYLSELKIGENPLAKPPEKRP